MTNQTQAQATQAQLKILMEIEKETGKTLINPELTKDEASSLIEKNGKAGQPASKKQISAIQKIAEKLGMDVDPNLFTAGEASRFIKENGKASSESEGPTEKPSEKQLEFYRGLKAKLKQDVNEEWISNASKTKVSQAIFRMQEELGPQ